MPSSPDAKTLLKLPGYNGCLYRLVNYILSYNHEFTIEGTPYISHGTTETLFLCPKLTISPVSFLSGQNKMQIPELMP